MLTLALHERVVKTRNSRARCSGEKPDAPDFSGLLRARHNWPRSRAAEQRDELAAFQRCNHSITSSASDSRLSEMLIPSAFAVFMLMISSNLVTCSTGSSAGFAPFRIFALYTPTCRYTSTKLRP